MKSQAESIPVKMQLSAGITSFLLTSSLSIAFAVVTSRSLVSALACIIACSFLSLVAKGNICAPDPLFTVPFFYIYNNTSPIGAFISISASALFFTLINKKMKNKPAVPDSVIAGTVLGLCLGATVLLTNSYFGIGASGATPFEMLKSYRSLGFHPHFMGLLTGTITLFTMITYPFKFKKLSKIIPPSFITVAIPYILNLWLNPDAEYTAINEATFFEPIHNIDFSDFVFKFSSEQIFVILEGILIFLWLFIVISDTREKQTLQVCNILAPFPSSPIPVKHYGLISAIAVIVLSLFTFFVLPGILSRLPIHCIGAMLIVLSWQRVPYKKIASTFKAKEKRILNIACFLICAVAFVIFNPYLATIICALAFHISTPLRKEKSNDC